MRRGESLCFGVYVNWAEVGFRYKSNSAFCIPFFFFFFPPARIVRFGRFRPESVRIGPSGSCVGASWLKTRGIPVARRGRTCGQRRPRRVAVPRRIRRGCGTSGAASVLYRFPVILLKIGLNQTGSKVLKFEFCFHRKCGHFSKFI